MDGIRVRTRALTAIACAAAALLAACGAPIAETQPPADTLPSPSVVASSSAPSTSPSPSPTSAPTSPLTGLAMDSAQPVLIMKIDNTKQAQPHAGLVDADVVYLEEVEYGITRIAAVFSSRIPARIGPVRSALAKACTLTWMTC